MHSSDFFLFLLKKKKKICLACAFFNKKQKQDCRCSLGGSFYTVDSKPVCGKCMGVGSDDEEEDSEWWDKRTETHKHKTLCSSSSVVNFILSSLWTRLIFTFNANYSSLNNPQNKDLEQLLFMFFCSSFLLLLFLLLFVNPRNISTRDPLCVCVCFLLLLFSVSLALKWKTNQMKKINLKENSEYSTDDMWRYTALFLTQNLYSLSLFFPSRLLKKDSNYITRSAQLSMCWMTQNILLFFWSSNSSSLFWCCWLEATLYFAARGARAFAIFVSRQCETDNHLV